MTLPGANPVIHAQILLGTKAGLDNSNACNADLVLSTDASFSFCYHQFVPRSKIGSTKKSMFEDTQFLVGHLSR